MENSILIAGIGKVLVDVTGGYLRPRTHVVGQRLGVGYASRSSREKSLQVEAARLATEKYGQPDTGWSWKDHSGAFYY